MLQTPACPHSLPALQCATSSCCTWACRQTRLPAPATRWRSQVGLGSRRRPLPGAACNQLLACRCACTRAHNGWACIRASEGAACCMFCGRPCSRGFTFRSFEPGPFIIPLPQSCTCATSSRCAPVTTSAVRPCGLAHVGRPSQTADGELLLSADVQRCTASQPLITVGAAHRQPATSGLLANHQSLDAPVAAPSVPPHPCMQARAASPRPPACAWCLSSKSGGCLASTGQQRRQAMAAATAVAAAAQQLRRRRSRRSWCLLRRRWWYPWTRDTSPSASVRRCGSGWSAGRQTRVPPFQSRSCSELAGLFLLCMRQRAAAEKRCLRSAVCCLPALTHAECKLATALVGSQPGGPAQLAL